MRIILGLLVGSPTGPTDAPAWLLKALQRVQVEQGDGGGTGDFQQGFSMTFRAERSQAASSDYALLKSPLLNTGNRIIVTVTLGTLPRVIVDGIIAHRQLAPTGTLSENSLTIMGKDISVLMDLDERDIDHVGLGDKQIVEKILGAYAKYGVTPEVSTPAKTWTPTQQERTPKQVGTDRQYLLNLARRHSFVFRIKAGSAPKQNIGYWGPLEYSNSPQKALTVNSGAATNAELHFSEDALAATQVFGQVREAGAAEPTRIDIDKSSQTTALAKTAELTHTAIVRKLRLVYSGASASEALSLAQAMTDRSTEQALKVTGSLDVFRYGDALMAPGKVAVRGAGFTYDGEYYIRKVTHDINRGEYRQTFELTREGTGSTTERVKT